ncbi:hypothetical protein [Dyadobacter diqingensis]|uniref:hypothetical protein n=1 Tax=Dyadobacter diqingensis TaxID=2938121 RepID=UPI0020C1BE85|nr:hypothetical protein [Dyadobacter diqingensis]
MTQRAWITIPVLSCLSIEKTLDFWELLGFRVTYKQTRPYPYGVVERAGSQLHFTAAKQGKEMNQSFTGCLVTVPDAEKVYQEFTQKLKAGFGKIPNTGIPRISRMKPGTTRFTLTDPAGNSIIFIHYGEKDQKTWERAENKNQTPLQKSIAAAVRFRDYKNDDKAAAAILDAALKRADNEIRIDVAEALAILIELADFMNDSLKSSECSDLLRKMDLSEEEINMVRKKHSIR